LLVRGLFRADTHIQVLRARLRQRRLRCNCVPAIHFPFICTNVIAQKRFKKTQIALADLFINADHQTGRNNHFCLF
jgi:hypothetical protein